MALRKRTQTPPIFKDYRKYKKYLRFDFDHRCAYCEIHEAEDGGSKKFHVDHYLPKDRFPEKSFDYFNLFYSCADCNTFKGHYWANWFRKWTQEYILNPCEHDYDIHFDRTLPSWIPKTDVAKWNIEKLRLNSKKQIDVRSSRDLFLKTLQELSKQKLSLESELKSNHLKPSDLEEVLNKIKELDQKIDLFKFKVLTPLD